jgi:hypothetical protein
MRQHALKRMLGRTIILGMLPHAPTPRTPHREFKATIYTLLSRDSGKEANAKVVAAGIFIGAAFLLS